MVQAVGHEDLPENQQEDWKQWLKGYKAALKSDGQSSEQRIQQQNSANPCYIPRNHLLQKAIEKAENRDFSEVRHIAFVAQMNDSPGILASVLWLWCYLSCYCLCASSHNKFASSQSLSASCSRDPRALNTRVQKHGLLAHPPV